MLHASLRPATDVFGELNRIRTALDEVFRPLERSSIRALAGQTFPAINVGTTPESIDILALAPGLEPGSLQVTADRGLLIIAGERRNDAPAAGGDASIYAQERFMGSFRRVIDLPEDADPARIQASYRDGILRVTVAKHEAYKPRRISIQ